MKYQIIYADPPSTTSYPRGTRDLNRFESRHWVGTYRYQYSLFVPSSETCHSRTLKIPSDSSTIRNPSNPVVQGLMITYAYDTQ